MELSSQTVFDQTAATYDPGRARLIPGYEDLYGGAVALLPLTARDVLDLGAGTGLLSAWVRRRLPHANLHLVDNSPRMLEQARQRFQSDPQTTFELADYTHLSVQDRYDAVVSALSIHHLPDASKQRLFRAVHTALRPGGVFINAEQILAPTPALETQARADWPAEVQSLGATPEQVSASLLRQTEDRCATVKDQLQWMRDAGFREARCTYQRGRFAVLFAER